MTKTERPAPRVRLGQYYCTICGKKFASVQGYNMHYLRAHDKSFKSKFNASVRARRLTTSSSSLTKSPSTKNKQTNPPLFKVMQAVLKTHGRPMRYTELIEACRSAGYSGTSNDSVFATYLTQALRHHPNEGVIQPQRGFFALGTPDQDYRAAQAQTMQKKSQKQKAKKSPKAQKSPKIQESPQLPQSPDELPPEIELTILRRRAIRNQEIMMGLTQLLMLSME